MCGTPGPRSFAAGLAIPGLTAAPCPAATNLKLGRGIAAAGCATGLTIRSVTPYEAAEVLSLFERADNMTEAVIWRVDMTQGRNRDIKLFALCSDFFAWATADLEEITKGDIPLLERCLRDLRKADDATYYLGELFAARKRRMRPQKPCYKDMEPSVAALFDACATEAERAEFDRRDAAFWANVAHTASKP